jgi:uncharacterized membrane protein HdeD (DUF308 family)
VIPTSLSDAERIRGGVTHSLQAHWRWLLTEGVVLIILGGAAILLPYVATITIAILVGLVVLASGLTGFVLTLRTRGAPGSGWSFISAVLGIVAGLVLLMRPITGAVSLTVVLTLFLILEGVVSIMYALDHRRAFTQRWSFMFASGVVDLILAATIFAELPGSAVWAIGLLLGINLVFGGMALIALALQRPMPRAN